VNVPVPVLFVLNQLQEAGYEAYVVGGAVRDLLLGKEEIFDWDITTSATPEQIQPLLSESFYDNNFGTVMVAPKHVMAQMLGKKELNEEEKFEDMDVLDITTFRSEEGYSDRRRPDKVEWGESLEEDVKRRDFTINAMALRATSYKLQVTSSARFEKVEVEIIDFNDGLKDLKAKLVRAVGDASKRFEEDALRMMRAIRIGAELSFGIEQECLEAISEKASLITKISNERVQVELVKILESDYPADGIMLLHTSGLLKYILPELEEGVDTPQGGRHKHTVFVHNIESLRECPSKDWLIRLATLLHDIGKPRTMKRQGPRGVTFYGHEVVGAHMCNKIADRLRLSKKNKNKLFTLVRWHMFTYNPEMTDAAIRRFIRRVGVGNINDMMMLRVGDRKGGGSRATSWRLRELQQRIGENLYEPMSVKDLKIDGHDLMKLLNVGPSRILGQVLNQLFEMVMEDEIENEKEVLEKKAVELAEKFGEEESKNSAETKRDSG